MSKANNFASGKGNRAMLKPLALVLTAFALTAAVVTPDASAQKVQGIVKSSTRTVELEINRGTLIRLPRPATDVFLGNPAVANLQVKSPTLLYVLGLRPGSTSLFVMGGNEEIIYNVNLEVKLNLEPIRNSLKTHIPDANIQVDSVNGSVVLNGFVASAEQADAVNEIVRTAGGRNINVINKLSINKPSQVNLRVRIAEMARGTRKQFGLNWDVGLTSNRSAGGNADLGSVFSTGGGNFFNRDTNTFFFDQAVNSLGLASGLGSVEISGLIEALETEGLVTVLAEPNLTALSGETAQFLAGGEVPIPVPDDRGLGVQFKEFGVQVAFTPVIYDDDLINLRVRAEVSEISATGGLVIGGFAVPAFTSRRAQTTIELGSGQGFAIAGLLQNNLGEDQSKTPFLGDIPILGALFRSDSFRRDETELVIIVTPYLVKPVDDRQLVTPLDGLRTPNDIQRYLKGQNKKPNFAPIASGGARGTDSGAPIGAGFVLN